MTAVGDGRLAEAVDRDRLARRLIDLVEVRSFPGEERECALLYAEMLRDCGMEVEIDEGDPRSPSVVARYGDRKGRTLQFAGHLDTVPVAHPAPYIDDGVIYGRGSSDMKAGLAAFAEVVIVLREQEVELDGSILITAYGQHEGSLTNTMHEPLRVLMRRGIKGDAVIVGDCAHGELPLKGKGSLIFDLTFSRPGNPEHELFGRQGIPHPLVAAHRFISAMEERRQTWTAYDTDLGGESFFVGSFHSGDVYNTVPTTARIEGTRRYPAPRTFTEAQDELEQIAAAVANDFGVEYELICHRSGQPYSVDPAAEIVGCVQEAAQEIYGHPFDFGVSLFATDLNHVVEVGQVPAVLCGVDGSYAHSTPELVTIADVVAATRLYLLTATRYLNVRSRA